MFAKILAALISFLLWLFPNNDTLEFYRLREATDHNQIATDIVDAINARDAAKLQSMMCLNINECVDDLPSKIGEFCDTVLALTDGRLIDYSLDIRSDVLWMRRPEFGQMQQDIIIIHFYKESVWYSIPTAWAICKGPEAGIRRIAVVNKTVSEVLGEIIATQYVA